VYLDGGFGVGKTHLLAAVWHAAPEPKSYLSFDELVHAVGVLGAAGLTEAFAGHGLIAVDEWELDDPGNLRMALAFLRGALASGACIVTTSNTLPDELGRGRFPQKDFRAEIEELSDAFEVLRIEGDDYRHRRFADGDRRELFRPTGRIPGIAAEMPGSVPVVGLDTLLDRLERLHPIRYGELIERIDGLAVTELRPIESPPRALRWIHFIDKLYDAAVPLIASSEVPLGRLFPPSLLDGAYGKKCSRCLSRLTELLGEGRPLGGGRHSRGPVSSESV
ncbi:MAG: AFG1/ZapE family ATPase, partial [Gemmatimonadota bacterium]